MLVRRDLLAGISSQELSEFERVISLISDNALAALHKNTEQDNKIPE
jgi:MarR family transcriptional regulator for hemolysin